jgi:hypothetical protein
VPSVITPTGTDTATTWLPTSLIVAPTPTSLASGATPTPQATSLAPGTPEVIQNPNGPVSAPEDTTLIQLGFLYQLNYLFVVQTPKSSAQIYQYLPQGIAKGLGVRAEQVVVSSLVPLNTLAQLNYTTTLAYVYIPSNMVNTLSLDVHIPTSALYNNDNEQINTLMSYINPAIPLTPGSNLAGSGTATGSGSAATTSSSSGNSGVYNNEQQNTSSTVSGTTAGIAVAAIGASAAYGAAMFLIARRYKQRKQSHRRSSSLSTHAEMRQSGSPAMMGGAFMSGGRTSPGHDRNSRGSGRTGQSARTQQISAPMMAENSLGWN